MLTFLYLTLMSRFSRTCRSVTSRNLMQTYSTFLQSQMNYKFLQKFRFKKTSGNQFKSLKKENLPKVNQQKTSLLFQKLRRNSQRPTSMWVLSLNLCLSSIVCTALVFMSTLCYRLRRKSKSAKITEWSTAMSLIRKCWAMMNSIHSFTKTSGIFQSFCSLSSWKQTWHFKLIKVLS